MQIEKQHLLQLISFLENLDGSWSSDEFNKGWKAAFEQLREDIEVYPETNWLYLDYE